MIPDMSHIFFTRASSNNKALLFVGFPQTTKEGWWETIQGESKRSRLQNYTGKDFLYLAWDISGAVQGKMASCIIIHYYLISNRKGGGMNKSSFSAISVLGSRSLL